MALLELSTDPTLFRTSDGSYDPAAHYGFQLTMDRLVATVKGILVSSRRDEFARSILMFQAFDLLKGLGFGDYAKLSDPKLVTGYLGQLRRQLPETVQPFVMPRTEAAVRALEQLQAGFFLHERITDAGLALRSKAGTQVRMGLHRATAEYLNLVRDAGHTWAEKLSSERYLSLFIAHNGDLPPELPDLAFLHFVRLMMEPREFLRRLEVD